MPGKNLEKLYTPHTYYHVYNRGVNKRNIFNGDDDYRAFLNILKRYLGVEVPNDPKGREYPNYHSEIQLLAYCLMPNHFHMLLYTKENPEYLQKLMSSLVTTYVMYFNKKTKRIGSLFGKPYRAVPMIEDSQLWHITRYIHLNPLDIKQDHLKYPYSSIGYYIGEKSSDWVAPQEIIEMFKESKQDYKSFLAEYIDRKSELDSYKNDLY